MIRIPLLLSAGLSAGLLIVPAGLPNEPPSLENALSRVRHNVEIFENQLPDFVCTETITSRTIADEKVEKETIIQSTFSGRQKRSALSKLTSTSFTEERRIETVNGAPWKEKSMPKGVFRVGGAYSSTLVSIFGPKGEANYSFSSVNSLVNPEGAVVISFATKNDRQKIKSNKGNRSFQETGRAWFDPVSFEILRLERQIVADGAEPGDEVPITIEYQPVRIADDTFRLPARVSATAHRVVSGKAERGEYEARYTDYRKYGSTSTIRYREK
jgi:hypothetical protein